MGLGCRWRIRSQAAIGSSNGPWQCCCPFGAVRKMLGRDARKPLNRIGPRRVRSELRSSGSGWPRSARAVRSAPRVRVSGASKGSCYKRATHAQLRRTANHRTGRALATKQPRRCEHCLSARGRSRAPSACDGARRQNLTSRPYCVVTWSCARAVLGVLPGVARHPRAPRWH